MDYIRCSVVCSVSQSRTVISDLTSDYGVDFTIGLRKARRLIRSVGPSTDCRVRTICLERSALLGLLSRGKQRLQTGFSAWHRDKHRSFEGYAMKSPLIPCLISSSAESISLEAPDVCARHARIACTLRPLPIDERTTPAVSSLLPGQSILGGLYFPSPDPLPILNNHILVPNHHLHLLFHHKILMVRSQRFAGRVIHESREVLVVFEDEGA